MDGYRGGFDEPITVRPYMVRASCFAFDLSDVSYQAAVVHM